MAQAQETAVAQVAETIRLGIKNGTFQAGEKLPPQREMETMFGVSRMVIREAIKILEGMGLLVSKQGSGIYIKQNSLPGPGEGENKQNRYTLADIIELSRLIWAFSISGIVQRAPESEIAELAKRNREMLDSYQKATAQQKFIYESTFGMRICKLGRNALAVDLMLELLKATSDIDHNLIVHDRNYKEILLIDQKLVEALLERNAPRAEHWAEERNYEIDRILQKSPGILKQKYNFYISQK